LQAFASAGVSVHLVSHLRESGFALSSAAMITGFMGAAQVPARLLFCQFQRVVSTRARLPLLLVVQAVSLVGVLGRTDVVVTCSVLLFGAASGLMTLERAMLIADSFGADEYGAVSGRLATFALATRAGAPVAVGVVRMATSYAVAFLALAILTALAGAILWTALREENETQWRRS
jgi:predicted MFS family arabinose efflux permease